MAIRVRIADVLVVPATDQRFALFGYRCIQMGGSCLGRDQRSRCAARVGNEADDSLTRSKVFNGDIKIDLGSHGCSCCRNADTVTGIAIFIEALQQASNIDHHRAVQVVGVGDIQGGDDAFRGNGW